MRLDRASRLKTHLASGGAAAKRVPLREASTESWFHYYAGFPASFASGVFRAANLGPDDAILDPWNGSGTTTEAARNLGLRATGIDINPVANLVSSARLASASDAAHISGLVEDLFSHAQGEISTGSKSFDSTDPLLKWLSPKSASFARAFQQRLLHLLATTADGRELNPLQAPLPPLAALLTLTMGRAIRTVAPPLTSSNPTWLKPATHSPVRLSNLVRAYRDHLAQMVHLLGKTTPAAAHQAQVTVLQADARSLPLDDSSISFVLTSPPYLTRVDYVVPTTLELALLGKPEPQITSLRQDLMGTPLTRSQERVAPSTSWSPKVRKLLDAIASHPARDSFSYYYKTYWQYFDDAHRSISELARVLVPGGLAILVAQNSYYKDIEVDLPGLLKSIGRTHGLVPIARVDTPVGRALTSINSRSQVHRQTRRYVEAALLLRREN